MDKICKFYQNGRCWRDKACRFRHVLMTKSEPKERRTRSPERSEYHKSQMDQEYVSSRLRTGSKDRRREMENPK